MTFVGIVGHAKDKFTSEIEAVAKDIIRRLLQAPDAVLVSGHCPIGGVDIWAEEIAVEMGRKMVIHTPEVNQWNPPGKIGFKARNLMIARDSDTVHVIVVREFPSGYAGRRFPFCYHCKDRNPNHIKSGGCWTGWKAEHAEWHII